MKWISVKDKLPEEGTDVLSCNIKSKEIAIDYIVKFESEPLGYIWACRLQDEFNNVTHWMPLPELPNELD